MTSFVLLYMLMMGSCLCLCCRPPSRCSISKYPPEPCASHAPLAAAVVHTLVAWLKLYLCARCSSVDMFLAIVVAALVWHWAAWAYDGRAWRPRHKTEPPDQRQWALTALILGVLAILAYIIIAGGA